MSSEADALFTKAEGKCNKLFFKDYEAAFELYNQAAARYKLDKNYDRAGEAYMRAGDCATKLKSSGEASQCYTDSANAYKKCDVKKAGVMITIAIQNYIENNKLGAAARLHKDFAEALEGENQLDEALTHYKQAMQYFDAEDQNVSVNTCLTKIANINGQLDRFEECIKLYEQLGNRAVGGPLKHQAKEFFLRAIICRLALVKNDTRSEQCAEANEALETYETIDNYLRNTREDEFLHMIIEAVEGEDVDAFEHAVSLLAELRMLDDWKTHVLLVAKKNLENIL
ncbi:soluble N-ethylmaleimide sensitive factor attachment, putative [Bodo saltans]|uniref:Soluble N-ethylmaleimide sensitive factor attachment, putative n=1 Tax=Bodo saltans TaxID=75058 RepID=A0A0S4JTB3_BODSA|nr:soluble N-ethylmaleimide sensitive factor attachment, putative [Bodo saltans]|eukprot:CUG93428.1 soluble N-ethylmaleimide sensitive factor attachment, putative [Bodo saltans]